MERKLSEVCWFYSGTGFPVTYQGKDKGELPFYKVGDISNNVAAGNMYLSCCNNYISRQEATEIKGSIIPPYTIVFAKIGEALKLNRRVITNCDCLIDNNVMGIKPNRDYLRTRYFYYYMKRLKMQDYAESTAVPSVRKSKLEQIKIDIPSLEEQERMEQALDKASAIIIMRQQQLQKLDELVKARFVELFGDLANPSCLWETIKLADACASADDIKCGPFGTQLGKGEYVDSGVAVWEIPQINAAFKACPTHFITEEKATQLKAYSLVPGDIAMSRKGNVGRCAIFPDEYVDGIIHSDVLNVTKLKQIYVHIPPKKLQDQFVSFVKQTDKSKVAVQKALDEAQLLFDSLMQKYFG